MELKYKPAEVYTELQSLGLTQQILSTAILEGEFARDSCTANDPPCVPGIFAYGRCTRSLRDQLLPLGWTRNDDLNRATVVSADGRNAIAVESGDEATGNKDLFSNTKYIKGTATKKVVDTNQNVLFENMYPTVEEMSRVGKLSWLLMRFRTDNAIYAELSLPAAMSCGRVKRWLKRIILDPISYGFDFDVNEDGENGAIEIPIRKRQQ